MQINSFSNSRTKFYFMFGELGNWVYLIWHRNIFWKMTSFDKGSISVDKLPDWLIFFHLSCSCVIIDRVKCRLFQYCHDLFKMALKSCFSMKSSIILNFRMFQNDWSECCVVPECLIRMLCGSRITDHNVWVLEDLILNLVMIQNV